MSAPGPSAGTQDLAEKVARAGWNERSAQAVTPLKCWGELSDSHRQELVGDASDWLDSAQAAGLAVVELPEPDEAWTTLAGTTHAAIGLVEATRYPDGTVMLNRGDTTLSAAGAREAACELLAGLAWAEHQGGESR